MLDEIADPVAAIQQPALLAVDVAEAGLGGDDPLEAGGVGASGLVRGGPRGGGGRVGQGRW